MEQRKIIKKKLFQNRMKYLKIYKRLRTVGRQSIIIYCLFKDIGLTFKIIFLTKVKSERTSYRIFVYTYHSLFITCNQTLHASILSKLLTLKSCK